MSNRYSAYPHRLPGGEDAKASPELLRNLLQYDPETGKLFWLTRNHSTYSQKQSERVPDLTKLINRWNATYAGKEAFTADDGYGYKTGRIYDRKYQAHQVIFAIMEGRYPDAVDHVDGNGSNNRWANLRECSPQENMRNRRRPTNNSSGYVGVSELPSGRFSASIHIYGKHLHLGVFSTKDDAATARAAAQKIAGFHDNHGRQA